MNVVDLEKKIDPGKIGQLDKIADRINKGEVILFLGSAVHCKPPIGFEEFYIDKDRPPTAQELAAILKEDKELRTSLEKNNSFEENWPLSWVAQYYELVNSRPELIKVLKDALANKKPSPIVNALAEMNFKYVLTTNYDTLFEQALKNARKSDRHKGIYKPNKIVGTPPTKTTDFSKNDISEMAPFIYKLHGDIDAVYEVKGQPALVGPYRLTDDGIVLTDEDYIQFIIRMGEKERIGSKKVNYNPFPESFTREIANPDTVTILFIGYSLMDINLRLLFKSIIGTKDISAQLRKWSVDMRPDFTIKEIFEDYNFTFIETDAWVVIPYLYKQIFNKDMKI